MTARPGALLRRLLPLTASGLPSVDPSQYAWVAVAFTYQGLEALGLPQESLDSFPRAFLVRAWLPGRG
ncbi:hypothetical protein OG930_42640 [Streptomyces sp. NBC_01799]|nr:hypothetical protein OG930_42640 [Streptomyces sp. NBC_01799]